MRGYKFAIAWICENDDTSFLDDKDGIGSVTAYFIVDIYGHSIEKVVSDMRKYLTRTGVTK